MKECNKCKEIKELSAFSSNKSALDKLCPTCKTCISAYNKAYRAKNLEKYKEYQAEYYQANAEAIKERTQQWYADTRETRLEAYKDQYQQKKEQQAAYYDEVYQDPEKRKERCERSRQWRKDNPDKLLAQIAYRRAKKLKATPAWANKEAILAIYKECVKITNETGILHHVDHIIPLNGTHVSGLHVESNLQILPATENIKKNNKFNLDA